MENEPKKAQKKHITDLFFSNQGLDKIPQGFVQEIIEETDKQFFLDLSHNHLKTIPCDLLSSANLVRLNLFSNDIEEIPDLLLNVDMLDIGCNKITKLPIKFSRITGVNADYNIISSIDSGSNSIQRISLHCNIISYINPNISFDLLTVLDLSSNKLKSLPPFADVTPNLHQIDLSHNEIEELSVFPQSLVILYAQHNKIKHIPEQLYVLNLTKLDLSNNQINYVGSFQNSLSTLNLSHNEITNIEPIEMEFLRIFDIKYNKLSSIPKINCKNVFKLDLTANCIEKVECSQIPNHITDINLSNNKIKIVTKELFSQKNLRVLNLKDNLITELPTDISESELIILNLSNNLISKLPDKLPKNLETLTIFNCGINNLPNSLIDNINFIELNAAKNNLETIPFLPNLISLNISYNNLNEFPILSKKIKNLDISNNKIICLPEDFSFPSLQSLSISSNKIKTFPNNFYLQKLNELNISNTEINLNVSNFPLKYINTSNSNTNIKNENKKLKIFGNELQNWFSLSTFKHKLSISFDVNICRSDLTLFVTFNGSNGISYTEPIISQLINNKNCIEVITNTISFAALSLKENCFVSFVFGNAEIITINENGNMKILRQNLSREIVNANVFGNIKIKSNDNKLSDDDKWIIISNVKLDKKLEKISFLSKNQNISAQEFADLIKLELITDNLKRNISIIVIDIKNRE